MSVDAAARMRGRGYKATPQRMAVFGALSEEPHQSFDDLRRRCEPVGTVTVYRTVELFLELGIARRLDFGDGPRYGVAGGTRRHYVCEPCGGVFDLGEQAPEIESFLTGDAGLTRVDVHGRCRKGCGVRG